MPVVPSSPRTVQESVAELAVVAVTARLLTNEGGVVSRAVFVVTTTVFDPRITSLFAYKGARTRFTQLVVTRLPKGAKVQLVCAGKSCAFKRKSIANKGAKLNVLKALKRLTLRSGAVLQLRITGAAGELKVATWKVRRGRAPSTTYRCAATRGAKLRTCT